MLKRNTELLVSALYAPQAVLTNPPIIMWHIFLLFYLLVLDFLKHLLLAP